MKESAENATESTTDIRPGTRPNFALASASSQISTQAGFTLVEILMVILIVGIMSAVVVPNYIDFSGEAKSATTKQKLTDFKMAITGDPRAVANGTYLQPGFENQVGSLPATINDLRVQGAYAAYDPFTKRGWRGPYISTSDANWDKDSWGTTITYTSATRTLRSCGPDKTCGNADDLTLPF